MRDINRIDNCCKQLAEIWKKVPDMRLGQLFNNFQNTIKNDCFYIEDDEFLNNLEKVVNEWIGK